MATATGLIVLSLISGVLYRIGGASWGNTKVRDFGCPTVALITLLFLKNTVPLLPTFIMFGLMFGAMTTYCKWITPGEEEDVRAIHWFVTGLLYGLSALPHAVYTGNYFGFFLRTIVLTIATCWWSQLNDDVVLEEGGRGFLFNVSLILL